MTAKEVIMTVGVAVAILGTMAFAGFALYANFTGRPNALTRFAERLCASAEENPLRYAVVLGMIVCGLFYCKSVLG